ncbi:MAG: flagellar basal body-associated protein FliL [Verrucomicrobiales bacterium]|nr:flagellar basal body-associated protein FliL [Verrucomicrobiales bacterium]
MAVNRIPQAGAAAAEMNGATKLATDAQAAAAAGGIKQWIPLLLNVVMMPILAYVLTVFVIVPRLRGGDSEASQAKATSADKSGAATNAKDGSGKLKVMAPLSGKVLVNIAGTMGTRYLLANVTLVGSKPDFKAEVEKNDAQLRDAAAGALSTKSIADLEKPGARNLIRTELINIFNGALGEGTVTDIYLTELAIQ